MKLRHFAPPALVLAALCSMVFSLSGCAQLNHRPTQDPDALAKAMSIQALNGTIKTCKGMARTTLIREGKRQSFRMAWAAQAPDRARIILTASGQPIETIIADGKRVTFFSHTRAHAPHTTSSANPDLKAFTQIPVKMSDLIALLLGQIPVMEFDLAKRIPPPSPRLILKKKWGPTQQWIHFSSTGKIEKLECFTRENRPDYTLLYKNFTSMQGLEIPQDFSIQDPQGQRMDIQVLKFLPNAPIKETVFRLTPSGS